MIFLSAADMASSLERRSGAEEEAEEEDREEEEFDVCEDSFCLATSLKPNHVKKTQFFTIPGNLMLRMHLAPKSSQRDSSLGRDSCTLLLLPLPPQKTERQYSCTTW